MAEPVQTKGWVQHLIDKSILSQGAVYYGVVTAAAAPSFTIDGLAGLGATKFVGWTAFVFRVNAGGGAAPQGESQVITAFTNLGVITAPAYTAPVGIGDEILISRPTGGAVTAFATGSFTPVNYSILSSTNAGPIVVTCTVDPAGLGNGDVVYIVGHLVNTSANGTWTVANINHGAHTFELAASVGVGIGGATGTVLLTTEIFVSNINVAGKFKFTVSRNPEIAGDVVELRIYKMDEAGGTPRTAYMMPFYGAPPPDAIMAISQEIWNALTDAQALRCSIRQTHGVARAWLWTVERG